MRRKLALGGLLCIGLMIALLHVQPVESRIWGMLVHKAGTLGFEIKAARMDLNLFALSVTLRQFELGGHGLSTSIERLELNGGNGLFFGNLDFDALLIDKGTVGYSGQASAPASKPETATSFSIPPIYLGQARIHDVGVTFEDKSTRLDLNLQKFMLDYQNQFLRAGFQNAATTLAGRKIPVADWSLQAKTADFQTVQEILFSLKTTESELTANGEIQPSLRPRLTFQGRLGKDLIPEIPGLRLRGSLDPDQVAVALVGDLNLADRVLPISAETRFAYGGPAVIVPVQIRAGNLASGAIDLRLEGGHLTGQLEINADGPELKQWAPYHEVRAAVVKARFHMEDMDPARLEVQAEVVVSGRPELGVTASWQNGAAAFEGGGALLPGSSFAFSGAYDQRLQLAFSADLPHAGELETFLPMPPQLCAGPLHVQGSLGWDGQTWRLDGLTLQLQGLEWEPHFRDDLMVYLQGPASALEGWIFTQKLNSAEETASFVLDAETQTWRDLRLNIATKDLAYENYRLPLTLRAVGKGPLDTPRLEGFFAATAEQSEPLAELGSSFQLEHRVLTLPGLEFTSAQGQARGQAKVHLQEAFAWDISMHIVGRKNPQFARFVSIDVPQFELHLAGNQDALQAKVMLPDQEYVYDELTIPMKEGGEVEANLALPDVMLDGNLPRIVIAGIAVRDLRFGTREDLLRLDADFRLLEPSTLAAALAASWPQDLQIQALAGRLELTSDLAFEKPSAQLTISNLEGRFQQAPFALGELALHYDGRLSIQPFELGFAGMRARFYQADPGDAEEAAAPGTAPPSGPFAISLAADYELEDLARLKAFAGDAWPEDFHLSGLSGRVMVFSDLQMSDPRVRFRIDRVDGALMENPIKGQDIRGYYHRGIWLRPAELMVGDLPVVVTKLKRGFQVQAYPGVQDINQFLPGFAGDAKFEMLLDVEQVTTGPRIRGRILQIEGQMVYLEHWLFFRQWNLEAEIDPEGNVDIKNGGGLVNGGAVAFHGSYAPNGQAPNIDMDVSAHQIRLDMPDMQATVTGNLRWESDASDNQIDGTVLIQNGYYHPEYKIEGLVEDLLTSVPELYFPDPFLESTRLNLAVLTRDPLIVESNIGYLEIETSLRVGGNLAEQKPRFGSININEGSTLQLGNQTFIFNASQIQFHPNRVDDPYLQISLESSDYGDKHNLNINGYLSDLDHNVGSNDLTNIVATYLMGKVSSLISLEGQFSETLFDSTFTFVVSKSLNRKLITRYAIPLVDQQQEQRFELTIGPYFNNFINFIRQDDTLSGNLQHSQRFGFAGERPDRIKKISFQPAETPKWVRKDFKLKKDDIYSETSWRRARLDLLRRMRENGHLEAVVSHEFDKGRLAVRLDPGPAITLTINGLDADEKDRRRLLGQLRTTDEAGLRTIERFTEQMAIARGHPSALAKANMKDRHLHIDVYVARPIGETSLDFGKAQNILADLYKDKKERRTLVAQFLRAPDEAKTQLRGRLAARGYLTPAIQNGYFAEGKRFVAPIDPGLRAKLLGVSENDVPVKSSYTGKPFEYSLIEKVRVELEEAGGPRTQVKVTPRQREENIVFEITRRKIQEPNIQRLEITGAAKIPERKIKRFLGFKNELRLGQLTAAQRRLIEAGPFRMARLQTTEQEAILEVAERNRWDADFQISGDERDGLGYGIQFKDRKLFNGFNDLALRYQEDEASRDILSRLRFQRLWGTPLDLIFGFQWNEDKTDPTPIQDAFFDLIDLKFVIPEKREWSMELSYPLTVRQRVSGGIVYQENILTLITRTYDLFGPNPDDIFSPENLIDETKAGIKTVLTPLRVSWLFNSLDRKTDPSRGVLASAGVDHFNEDLVSSGPFTGTRISLKLSTFLTRGRFFWTQRFEWGWLIGSPPEELRPGELEDSLFFVLGGPTSIRGFEQDFVGPLEVVPFFVDGMRRSSIGPLGGQALSFFSEELTYKTDFYGLGISPFLDGGWVWENAGDLYGSEMVVTGGLGLSFDTPIGYFRFDWATPLRDQAFEEVVNQFPFEEDRALAREKGIVNFSFRFGRVF